LTELGVGYRLAPPNEPETDEPRKSREG